MPRAVPASCAASCALHSRRASVFAKSFLDFLSSCCATQYLRETGEPRNPRDLLKHSLILGPAGNRSSNWVFHRKGRRTTVHVEPRLATSSNESAIAAAIAGLGIAATATWGCRAELERGLLVSVLNGWKMGFMELNALSTAGRAAKPAARAFVEYLAAALHE